MTNPLVWMLSLLLLALISARFMPRLAVLLAALSVACLVVMLPPVAAGLSQLWEHEYRQGQSCLGSPAPDLLVLLPAGIRPHTQLPASSLTSESLIRLEHSQVLAARYPGLPAVVVGTESEILAFSAAHQLWQPGVGLNGLSGASNTDQAALLAAQHVRTRNLRQVVLVTSALHMRRSLLAFDHHGLAVCPSAATFTGPADGWLPNFRSLKRADNLLHEVLGFWYYRFKYAG